MSKGRKSNYPERPVKKGRPKSSSQGGNKKKTWMSLRDLVVGGKDLSARLNLPWWKSPMMKTARLNKAAS